MEDLWERDHFFSNPAKIESFRRWRASFGDMRELMSAADATTPLFWAAERASKSSIRVSILYMATSLTNFQMHVRMTNKAPITMHVNSMIWMPRLLSCSGIVGRWRNEVAAGNGRRRVSLRPRCRGCLLAHYKHRKWWCFVFRSMSSWKVSKGGLRGCKQKIDYVSSAICLKLGTHHRSFKMVLKGVRSNIQLTRSSRQKVVCEGKDLLRPGNLVTLLCWELHLEDLGKSLMPIWKTTVLVAGSSYTTSNM